MKIPGPDHPITIVHQPQRMRATFNGQVIAESAGALTLTEAQYPPVTYFPRQDVDMAFLSRTDRHTHCPYKGDAAYYSIVRDGAVAEDAVWTYETPFPAVAQIAGHLAFYPNHVQVTAVASETPDSLLKVDQPYKDTGAI